MDSQARQTYSYIKGKKKNISEESSYGKNSREGEAMEE